MQKVLRHFALLGCLFASGCALLPEIERQPTVHNPFPQLSKVAVAPFFNLSTEKTVDGRQVALAYFNELQLVPGFEVVPIEVVEKKINEHHLAMAGPGDARLLAQLLGVDAVVVGAVTDFSPYPPPRMVMQVEWYAANPNFHPIPPGYGLPWGSPEEQDIPAPLVFEAEFALAKEQLKTQTPSYEKMADSGTIQRLSYQTPAGKTPAGKTAAGNVQAANATVPAVNAQVATAQAIKTSSEEQQAAAPAGCLPPNWPDPRGFIPPPPSCRPRVSGPAICRCCVTRAPTTATTWSLPRRCPATITSATRPAWGAGKVTCNAATTLSDSVATCTSRKCSRARGGAGETRVVWRWPTIR